MSRGERTPSFELRPPKADQGDPNLQRRIAQRLFGADVFEDGESAAHIAHFRILQRVGAGGMGMVYAAFDTRLERTVAIKVVRREALAPRARARLLDEARSLAKLSHPNVVPVFEAGEHEGQIFVSMEYVEGQTLRLWQSQERPLRALLGTYAQAGAGLQAAHEAGIIHRDFKPNNVLVGDDGRVRVVDFGLAQVTEGADSLEGGSADESSTAGETARRVAGTPGYIAPELLAGEGASAASDQFSFCVALWEALSGFRPFDGATLVDASAVGRDPTPRGRVSSRWLRRALTRGLALDPSRRWPSVAALSAHVESQLRWRRVAGRSALPLLAGASLSVALASQSSYEACDGAGDLSAVWGEEQARRVSSALSESPESTSAQAVTAELDRYARMWTSVRGQLCEDHVGGRLSAEGLDLGGACLDEGRQRLELVLDRLLGDPEASLQRADALLDTLPDPMRCADARRLRALPRSAGLVSEAPGRAALREARVHLAMGEFTAADALAREVLGVARDSRQFALVAAAHQLAGAAAGEQGRVEVQRRELIAAEGAAERAGDLELTFQTRIELAEVAAHELENAALAESMLDLAHHPFERLGEPAALAVELLAAQARVAELQGEHGEAEALLRRALSEAFEVEGGLSPRRRTRLRVGLANAMADQDKAEALPLYLELLAIQRERYSISHPEAAMTAFNIGLTLYYADRPGEAEPYLVASVRGQERSRGSGSVRLASPLLVLADVEAALGRELEAIAHAERALVLQGALVEGHSERGMALSTLAWARLSVEDYGGALAMLELLLRDGAPCWVEQRPTTHVNVGWLLCRLGQCAQVQGHVDQGLASVDSDTLIRARLIQGEMLLARGLRDAARELAKTVLDGGAALELETEVLAEARYLYARAGVEGGSAPAASERLELLAAREFLARDQRAWVTKFIVIP